MAEYRIPEFTLEQRTDVALQMLLPRPDRQFRGGQNRRVTCMLFP
jgi:hypothetical protein